MSRRCWTLIAFIGAGVRWGLGGQNFLAIPPGMIGVGGFFIKFSQHPGSNRSKRTAFGEW